MEGPKEQYWCYICSKQYEVPNETHVSYCRVCDSQCVEIIERKNGQSVPSEFEVFEVENKEQRRVLGELQSRVGPRRTNQAFIRFGTTTINDLSTFPPGSFLSNILNQLMNSGRRIKAATPQQIAKLQTISKVAECAICQEEQLSQEQQEDVEGESKKQQMKGYGLPCHHEFHRDCITPWFQKSSTCPVCRKNIDRTSS